MGLCNKCQDTLQRGDIPLGISAKNLFGQPALFYFRLFSSDMPRPSCSISSEHHHAIFCVPFPLAISYYHSEHDFVIRRNGSFISKVGTILIRAHIYTARFRSFLYIFYTLVFPSLYFVIFVITLLF